ncbi:MAG: hypothetical protein DI603_05735 [Roseateles depolymerans]|uniref:Uncharacterized protein n=1 Tax=Roseateles depolymerans TaxID=76731 RepID=A0A2W5DR88_9BURK|nr:MAG: hypothetical protein DI603_05735 [Roseateles depolymerans]
MTSISSLAGSVRPQLLSVAETLGPPTSNKPALTLNLPGAGVSASISLEGLNALAASARGAVQTVKHDVNQVIDGAQAGLTAIGHQLDAGVTEVSNALSSAADAVGDVVGYGATAVSVALDALA